MIYKGSILDSNEQLLPGATLSFTNGAGTTLVSFPVNQYGIWSFDTDTDNGLLDASNSAVFSAPGFVPYSISAGALPSTFNVNLNKKINAAAAVGIGAGIGILLLSSVKGKKVSGVTMPKSETVKTILYIGGGIVAFTVVKKILETTGVWKSASDKAVDTIAQDPTSFWNPNYWQQGPGTFTYALTEDQAHDFAVQVWDGMGIVTDNAEEVKSVFRNMVTKANVSFIAWKFQKMFGRDLLSFLKTGKIDFLPWNGLSSSDIVEINNYVSSLPNY